LKRLADLAPNMQQISLSLKSVGITTKKVLLAFEFSLVFIGLPLCCCLNIWTLPRWGTLVLLSFFAFFTVIGDPLYKKNNLAKIRFDKKTFVIILKRFTISAAALVMFAVFVLPNHSLVFSGNNFLNWFLGAVVYTVFSAFPQEILYRVFFLFRYKDLFPGTSINVASILSFLHIIYGNIIAVFLTFIGGYYFCKTYNKTGSLILVGFEHAAYGYFLFTIGIGDAFFF
jgi:hypothetical protein